MNQLAIAIVGILIIFAIIETGYALIFVSKFSKSNQKIILNDSLPKAAIILSLRGADPFLPDCISALLKQNYPEYKLHIIIDSQEDPAWQIVNQTVEKLGATNFQISPLTSLHKTCSLKGSSLVQAISTLDDSYKVVTFVDSDVIPHPNWLRELAAPLADENIGATTGNRWYIPSTQQWGSLVRYVWNAPAVVFMSVLGSIWGGSMAMKLSVLRQSGLLKIWTESVSVDTHIRKRLLDMGLKVKFVPTVLMSNCEECNLGKVLSFIKRQLLVTRLYSSTWKLIASQVLITTFALLMALFLLIIALAVGNFNAALWLTNGFFGYILIMALLLLFVEHYVQGILQEKGEAASNLSPLIMIKLLLAIPLTQLVYGIGTVLAILAKKVEWRGITYQIETPWDIRLLEYRPYKISQQPINTKASI